VHSLPRRVHDAIPLGWRRTRHLGELLELQSQRTIHCLWRGPTGFAPCLPTIPQAAGLVAASVLTHPRRTERNGEADPYSDFQRLLKYFTLCDQLGMRRRISSLDQGAPNPELRALPSSEPRDRLGQCLSRAAAMPISENKNQADSQATPSSQISMLPLQLRKPLSVSIRTGRRARAPRREWSWSTLGD
jgi:hypothetical protein